MAITVTTDVFCDGVLPDGTLCQQWTNGVTGPRSDATAARVIARQSGWVRSRANGKDYCPPCHRSLCGK